MENSIPPPDQPNSSMQHRIALLKNRRVQAALVIALVLLCTLPLRYALFLALPAGKGNTVRSVDFAKGETLAQIALRLEREGIVSSARLFVIHASLKGAANRLQAGEYQFSDGMRPTEILRKMVSGKGTRSTSSPNSLKTRTSFPKRHS